MKIPEALKTTTVQHAFEVGLVILLLLVLPMLGPYLGKYGGGTAMLVTSIVGLVAYLGIYGERLRGGGQLKQALLVTGLSLVLGAVVALGAWFLHSYLH